MANDTTSQDQFDPKWTFVGAMREASIACFLSAEIPNRAEHAPVIGLV
jgi:hypothetical protein